MIALALGAIFIFSNKFFVEAKVLISEVMTKGETATDEFIELYNYSSSTENLSDWKMCKCTKSGNIYPIVDFSESASIAPFGYLLLAHSDYTGSVAVDTTYSKNSLADDNYIFLYNSSGATVDSAGWGNVTTSYRATLDNPKATESLVRLPNDETGNWQDNDDDVNDFILTDPDPQNSSSASRPYWVEGTTTTPTSTVEVPTTTPDTPTTTSSTVPIINTSSIWSQIKINEFVSDPQSGNEWVEFFNPSTSSLDLSGGYICDERGATSSYACKNISGEIGANGWLYFDLLTTSYLNNDGDSLFLKNCENETVDEITYDNNSAADKGESYARISDGADANLLSDWALTTSITPGAQNIITAPVVSSGGGSPSQSSSKTTIKTETTTATTTATTTLSKNYSGIILNEILPNPVGADTENEFMEIFNTTSAAIDLSGWKISDSAKAFGLSGSIAAKSYLYYLRSETNIALNNSTFEEVKLIAPNDELADYISYDSADEGAAYARTASGTWEWTTSSTPGAQNYFYIASIIYDTSTPAEEKIFFTEICPNPKGADEREFIEIFNNDNKPIDVGNWTIANLKKRFVIPEETMIYPGEYLVFYKAVSKLTLNNSQEELTLQNAFGQTADNVKIVAAKEGMSYARANDAWQWTEELTPAKENKIVITPAEEKSVSTKNKIVYRAISIAGAREAESDTGAIVRGVVSVLPGNFGVQYFYVFDGKDGIQIYNSKKDFLKFKIGDKVEITGVIGEASGVRRIKTKDKEAMDILSTDNVLMPVEKSLDEIGEEDAGRLVAIEGDITEIKSNYMYLDNKLGEIKIYFKKGANINKSAHAEGDRVRVTGIVEMGSGGVQIWPRDNMDIVSVSGTQKVAGIKIETKEAGGSNRYIFAFAGLFAVLILGLIVKNYGASFIAKLKK